MDVIPATVTVLARLGDQRGTARIDLVEVVGLDMGYTAVNAPRIGLVPAAAPPVRRSGWVQESTGRAPTAVLVGDVVTADRESCCPATQKWPLLRSASGATL